jgi:hypothetical protein
VDIKGLEEVVGGKSYFYSRMHDYTLKEDHISGLGLYQEDMEHLRTLIPEEWSFVETRRNPDNDFIRINIVKNK